LVEIVLQGLAAGLGTCLGAGAVIAFGRLKPSTLALLLGLAAGIMSSVVIFDLLPSSLRYGGFIVTISGFAAGTGIMAVMDMALGLLSPSTFSGKDYLKMGYLIAAGIALHDLPEGLAIAAGFAAPGNLGPLLVLAIGLHNIPEGMATAAPLRYGGLGAAKVLLINVLISLVTPLGTYLGVVLVEASRVFIGLLLAFAAGAMTYIVTNELIPEASRYSRLLACLGVLAGAAFMSALNFIA